MAERKPAIIGRPVIVFRRAADGSADLDAVSEGRVIRYIEAVKQISYFPGMEDTVEIEYEALPWQRHEGATWQSRFKLSGLKKKLGESHYRPICFAFMDEDI